MCDCKTQIEEKLLENFQASEPRGVGHEVELQGYGFAVRGGQMVVVPFAQYKGSVRVPLKNSGGFKTKKVGGYMHFSHCPYCGEKLPDNNPYPSPAGRTSKG